MSVLLREGSALPVLALGVLLGLVERATRDRRREVRVVGLAGFLALLSVGCLLLVQTIPARRPLLLLALLFLVLPWWPRLQGRRSALVGVALIVSAFGLLLWLLLALPLSRGHQEVGIAVGILATDGYGWAWLALADWTPPSRH